MNEFHIEVQGLDSGFGYIVILNGVVDGNRTQMKEHYATEAAAKVRLATAWDWWAAQVDSE